MEPAAKISLLETDPFAARASETASMTRSLQETARRLDQAKSLSGDEAKAFLDELYTQPRLAGAPDAEPQIDARLFLIMARDVQRINADLAKAEKAPKKNRAEIAARIAQKYQGAPRPIADAVTRRLAALKATPPSNADDNKIPKASAGGARTGAFDRAWSEMRKKTDSASNLTQLQGVLGLAFLATGRPSSEAPDKAMKIIDAWAATDSPGLPAKDKDKFQAEIAEKINAYRRDPSPEGRGFSTPFYFLNLYFFIPATFKLTDDDQRYPVVKKRLAAAASELKKMSAALKSAGSGVAGDFSAFLSRTAGILKKFDDYKRKTKRSDEEVLEGIRWLAYYLLGELPATRKAALDAVDQKYKEIEQQP